MRKPRLARRAPIQQMPVLPMFYRLEGRRVLLVGGGEDALWKAELLLAAGAQLRVCASVLCDEFERLLAAEPRIELVRREWCDGDFQEAALALGAFDEEQSAAAFAAAARAAGVPVNLIDRPGLCDFQFGSIVNRAPAVISISTNGAAPILGQAIRQRIEAVLPDRLGAWTDAAARWRMRLKDMIPDAKARAGFWRRFAEAAFVDRDEDIDQTIEQFAMAAGKAKGKVSLVGAGPGASDLLTIRGVRALQSADVILFDDLVSDDVLDFARREAKRITVGKRGGRASCKQDDINALMIKLARQGRRVVRLKAGDPMVFGRGGEEIEQLRAAGVEVETVPGVTTALAFASSTMTSLTHRDHAQGVKFITGHSRKGALPDLDWRACADPATTLIVYMGARSAPALAEKLISHGLDDQTPAMIASAVSRDDERVEKTTLCDLQDRVISADAPVILGIGRVFQRTEDINSIKTTHYDQMQNSVAARG